MLVFLYRVLLFYRCSEGCIDLISLSIAVRLLIVDVMDCVRGLLRFRCHIFVVLPWS